MSTVSQPRTPVDETGNPSSNSQAILEYANYFACLQQLWKNNRKEDFTRKIQQGYATVADPYKLAFVCVKLCPDLYKFKGNGMAAIIIVELQYFLDENREPYTACLTETLQKDVLLVAMKVKNTGMIRLLVKAYHLGEVGEQFVPTLRAMILDQNYKAVCTLASLLGLQGKFSTEELIIPLFFQDRLCFADEFLDSSPSHQKEIVIFIDSLIGKEPGNKEILEKNNIKDLSRFKSSKILSSIAAKLLKRYKMDMSICPHLYKRRAMGGLRYLFYKYYIEKGLQASGFHSLVEDALKESPDLKLNLLQLFCEYGDPMSAVPYVSKLNLSSENVPHSVKDAMYQAQLLNQSGHGASNVPQEEECWEDDDESYSLSIPLENIIFIDTVPGFEDCVKTLSRSSVIGLDSEWKPTFGIGTPEQVALMQLATLTHVFLIDIVTLQPVLDHNHWAALSQIFTNIHITKLGYGIRGDFKVLANLHAEFRKALTNAKNVIDLDQKKTALLSAKPNIFSYSPSSYKGLCDMVYRCFGQPLNKGEQFSNWASRPLTNSQKHYAALDARCLVDIYNYLNAKAQDLSVADWKNIKVKPPQAKPKKQKMSKTSDKSQSQALPTRNINGPTLAKDFHVVCDTMLQGLAKKLRLCGIDAVALENGQSADDCIEYFEKEKRVVMTRGAAYMRLRKFVPTDFICHVESDSVQEQLIEVMQAFKVEVEFNDVFTRCTNCNCNSFIITPSSVVKKLKATDKEFSADHWTVCSGGRINLASGCTESGALVCLKKVTSEIIESVDMFKVCALCGKCYWEGFHQSAPLSFIESHFMNPNSSQT